MDDVVHLELEARVEGGVIRRFFACVSVDVPSALETLFSFEAREVVDLLPMPFSRVLNFLFVAFMAAHYAKLVRLNVVWSKSLQIYRNGRS